jgi:hypothetical protein
MADGILRRCPRCGEHKEPGAFVKQRSGSYCRPCDKEYKREHYLRNREKYLTLAQAWREANPERKKANDAAYAKNNRARVNALSLAWTKRNPEIRKAAYTASRHRNIEAYRAREAAYRERNRAECNARIREWKGRNPDAVLAYSGKRRAAELRAIPVWADLDAIAAIYREAKARGAGHHVDHIVPLISPRVCGLHCAANMQVLTATENLRKNNRVWPNMWEEP